ncbi:MAG: dihydroorotase [Candidatus Omnitrophica bacterium]|nr:dihydroorotase [Candidatus Omnitrophota bacterium]
MSILIKNGRVINPATNRDGIFDILIEDGRISEISKNMGKKTRSVIDANDKIVAPGVIDMHVHLREPGREDMETVASGTRAAVSGGITSICAMPNTYPALDSVNAIKRLKGIIKKDASNNVFVIGAITKGRKGLDLVDMAAMRKEGALAFSDDGNSLGDEALMSESLKMAGGNNAFLISHCEDRNISKNGVMNEGITATKLGLRGIPKQAEYEFVERDIRLAEKTRTKIHIAHVSCKESIDIIKKAKTKGVQVTAETAPHYFSLTEEACVTYDTRTKMNPPLRALEDVEAIKEALRDGTIDVIASDHAPHGKHDKEVEFDFAAFGIIGLETLLPLAIAALVEKKMISWMKLVELVSLNPAKILGLSNKGNLSPGKDADIIIIDPLANWVYTKDSIKSKSKNTPFINWKFKGKVETVISGGREIFTGSAGSVLNL